MIKSKIEARERALELVASLGLHDRELIMDMAKEFTDFLIGDAELPEFVDESIHIRELLDFTKKEMEKINNQNNFNIDEFVRKYRSGEYGMTGNTPCKSEIE